MRTGMIFYFLNASVRIVESDHNNNLMQEVVITVNGMETQYNATPLYETGITMLATIMTVTWGSIKNKRHD